MLFPHRRASGDNNDFYSEDCVLLVRNDTLPIRWLDAFCVAGVNKVSKRQGWSIVHDV